MNSKEGNRKHLTRQLQTIKSAMKPYATILFVILVSGALSLTPVLSSLMSNAVIRSSGTLATISPLHVEGRYIKGCLGSVILLKGVNHGCAWTDNPNGWWNPEGGAYTSGNGVWNPEAVKYNLDGMKSWGCNLLRIHTVIKWWLENTDNYRQHIKDMITWAAERGLYVIFEPCFIRGYPESFQYPLPFAPYTTDPIDAQIMPNQQAFIDYWASVATELKEHPNVLFEIYNEPHGNETVRNVFFNVTQQWIDAVRATGASQLLIVQWGYGIWCNLDYPPPSNPGATMDWVEQYPLNDPLGNIVYSFHNYRGDFHRTIPEYEKVWEYDDIKLALQTCLVDYVLNNLSKPVIVGEIGANMWNTGENLERELAYLNNSLTIYNEWNIGYCIYSWTIPAHMRHGVLQNGYPWLPPPNEAGNILINAIAKG